VSAERPVAVLDSSVLVPQWSRIALVRMAERRDAPFSPVWSEWIIGETWRVLTSQWLARATGVDAVQRRSLARTANQMMRYLIPVMILVSLRGYAGPEPWPQLPDPDDAPLWETAVVAGARYVISHNVRHFPPLVQGRYVYQGVEYLTAVEFVEDLLGESAAVLFGGPVPAGGTVRSRRVG